MNKGGGGGVVDIHWTRPGRPIATRLLLVSSPCPGCTRVRLNKKKAPTDPLHPFSATGNLPKGPGIRQVWLV